MSYRNPAEAMAFLEEVEPHLDELYGVRKVGTLGRRCILVDGGMGTSHRGIWAIGDNGGEFNVWKVNENETTVDIPHSTDSGLNPTALQTAYRIGSVITGHEIDWEETLDFMVESDPAAVSRGAA